VFAIFVASAYLTLPAVGIGALSVAIHAVRSVLPSIGGWLLVAPLLLDLTSSYLHVTHLLGRTREHGQAGLSWFYYAPFSLFGLDMIWWWRIAVLAGFTGFHACCQYYVPLAIARRLGWRPCSGNSAS
jgi:hypothetical protein